MKLPPRLADLYSQLRQGLDRDDPDQAELARELDEIAEVLEIVVEDEPIMTAVQNSALSRGAKRNSLLRYGRENPAVPLRIGPRPDRCRCCGRKL